MSGENSDGRIRHLNLHLNGDPVRIYEPAVITAPPADLREQDREREQERKAPEHPTIVLGRD